MANCMFPQDEELARIVAIMENREDWTVDNELAIRSLLTRMGDKYQSPQLTEWASENPKSALIALGSISTGKCIEIVRALDEQKPGFANMLLLYARCERKNPVVGLLPKRLFCLHRVGLLSQIFSPDRFRSIEAVIAAHRRAENASS